MTLKWTLLRLILTALCLLGLAACGRGTHSRAQLLITEAEEKMAGGDLDGVLADCTAAIRLDPKLPAAYLLRGRARMAAGQAEAALADFDAAIALEPKGANGYYLRGLVMRGQDAEAALADFDRAIALAPEHAAAFNERGLLKLEAREYAAAVTDFDRAIALDPKDRLPWQNRGLARLEMKEYEAALADFERLIDMAPREALGYVGRAEVRQAQGDVAGALTEFGRALELDNDNAAIYRGRGILYLKQHRWREALADFGRFCSLEPEDQDYEQLFMWICKGRLGDLEVADILLASYLEGRDPKLKNDWFAKIAGHVLGDVSEVALFAAAASPDPQTDQGQRCEAWYYAGLRRLRERDREGATAAFRDCVAVNMTSFIEHDLAKAELAKGGE